MANNGINVVTGSANASNGYLPMDLSGNHGNSSQVGAVAQNAINGTALQSEFKLEASQNVAQKFILPFKTDDQLRKEYASLPPDELNVAFDKAEQEQKLNGAQGNNGSSESDAKTFAAVNQATQGRYSMAFKHEKRNRYPNTLPNECTRFQIKDRPLFYFNANCVLGDPSKAKSEKDYRASATAIACQGPLLSEINEFWEMVWYGNVTSIAMLVNCYEGGTEKCSVYFPDLGAPKTCGDITVDTTHKAGTGLQEFANQFPIVHRTVMLTRGNEKREVMQYNLRNWPDHGVIPPAMLAYLVQLVDSNQEKTKGIAVAHCSAGIGRSGTFLAVLGAYQAIKRGCTDPDIFYKTAKQLRTYETGRNGSIQTDEQYILGYHALRILVNHLGK